MAVRLSVIMVHSPPAASSAAQLAESVVGELIGRGGIDLTLVGPFSQLAEQSTDRLTLDSLTGDVAVLDWQSPAEIVASLLRLGFQGQRSPHPHDPDVTAVVAKQRRVYAFDLNGFTQPGEVIAALGRLKEERQVKTFSLGQLPVGSKAVAGGSSAERPSSPKQATGSGPIGTSAGASNKVDQFEPDPPAKLEADGRPEPLDLDQLLDELDQLDP